MTVCESCGAEVGLFHRNLFGRTRLCPLCRRAAAEQTPTITTKNRLVDSLVTAGTLRRFWVGATRGALCGLLIPAILIMGILGGAAQGDHSLVPKGTASVTAAAAVSLATAAGLGWWWFEGWIGGLLSAWAASILLGAAIGARAGLQGKWGWLSGTEPV